MKRTVFTIVIIILFGAFASLYSFENLRTIFIGMLPQLENIYLSIDSFFLKIWNVLFASWVKIDYVSHPELPGTVIVGLGVLALILIVDISATAITNSRKNRKARFEENITNELEKLESNEAPSEFTHYDVNNVVFANNKTPLVTLENELVVSSKSDEEKAQNLLNDKKAKPLWRTLFSVLYVLFLGLIIFLRVVYHHHYSIEPTFAFILENEFVAMLFENFDSFFKSLAGGLKGHEIFKLLGSVWTAEQLIEYILIFVVGILLLTVILLICHFILKKSRKRRNLKHRLNTIFTYKEGDISNKNLSFFGYADTRDVKGDVRTIAKLSNSEAKESRERAMYKRAAYIDDISEGVVEKGVVNLGGFVIEPSPTRKPLIKEELEEDLSMNENVTLEDIVSIEDKTEEVISADKIETFVVKDEGLNYVDPNLIDVNLVADLEKKKLDKLEVSDLDDNMMFDEDGYAYLVKEGKNFVDDEEDISDIIELDELDKTAIIDRFGESYYSLLNDLEPFHLHKLKYDEEVDRIKESREDARTIEEKREQYDELASYEFGNRETESDNSTEEVNETIDVVEEPVVPEAVEEIDVVEEPVVQEAVEEPESEEIRKPIDPISIHVEDKIEEVEEEVKKPISSSLRPILKPVVPIREKHVVDEETLEANLNKLRDPLEGQRKARPVINLVKIRITREKVEPKVEIKKDDGVVRRVPLCKFRKPLKQQLHRRIDIKPLDFENKKVTDLNNIKPLEKVVAPQVDADKEKPAIKKPVDIKPVVVSVEKPLVNAPAKKPATSETRAKVIVPPKKLAKPQGPLKKPGKPKPLDVKSIDSSKFIK